MTGVLIVDCKWSFVMEYVLYGEHSNNIFPRAPTFSALTSKRHLFEKQKVYQFEPQKKPMLVLYEHP